MNRIRRELSYNPATQVVTLDGYAPVHRTIEVDVTPTPVEGQPGVYTAEVSALATMGDVLIVNPQFDG
jgi:hypothetical protein